MPRHTLRERLRRPRTPTPERRPGAPQRDGQVRGPDRTEGVDLEQITAGREAARRQLAQAQAQIEELMQRVAELEQRPSPQEIDALIDEANRLIQEAFNQGQQSVIDFLRQRGFL